MNPSKRQQIKAHAQAIGALLYEETPEEQISNLEDLEITVRAGVIEFVSPEIAAVFIEKKTGTKAGRPRKIKSSIGELNITKKQADKLQVKSHRQLSPHLEKCCLLLSANESYENAEKDLVTLTGMAVGHSTQQRLVQRQEFSLPQSSKKIEEISIDGGKVRLRTPKGQPCEWRDYKAVNLHNYRVEAFFRENRKLVNWVNVQPLEDPLICLGDGHDGIWNIFSDIRSETSETERCEILDWYHLIENIYKLGGSIKRLKEVEALLWRGQVESAIDLFKGWNNQQVNNFIAYLKKHRHRIINYQYYQAEGISIGSGSVESTVKQIGRRVKISGAQWKMENVPKVLLHRCAYLNGEFSDSHQQGKNT